ncbi:MAG: hypothetical protein JW909_07615 [Planctomycetes bacterium]|nr:hypothetical protein [Planctomycetota bacterium]
MQRALSLLTIVLAVAAFVVLAMTEKRDTRSLQNAAGRANNLEDRSQKASSSFQQTSATLQDLEMRTGTLSVKIEESLKPLSPPSRDAVLARTDDVMKHNWSEFLAKFCLAQGSIGVVSSSDSRTVKALQGSLSKELEKFGIRGKELDQASQTLAESIVLYGKARIVLGRDRGALQVERSRLISDARRKLAGPLQKHQLDRVVQLVESRLRY